MSQVAHQPSLLGAIRGHAQERPTERALIFLDAEGREQKVSTWAEVYADAGRAAQAWQAAGIRPGNVAVIVLDHSYNLVAAFLGALWAGAAPLIMPPLRDNAQQAFSDHLVTLVKYTRARAVFTTDAVADLVGDALAGLDCTVQMFKHAGAETSAPDFPFYPDAPTQPLYLQLTSGTTGMPKAAVLSQQAALTNIERVADARYRTGGPVVGCMPFHHDGGLVLCLLIPLVKGFPSVHIRPADWIARPGLLWQAVSAYCGTVTFLPNFALNFMVRRLAAHPQQTYDLSSLSTVIVGAELVMNESLQHFYQYCKRWGLQEEALCSAYGMAEQVAGVSFARWGQPTPIDWIDRGMLRDKKRAVAVEANAEQAHSVVSCGVPLAGIEVRVVDEAYAPLLERHIGEILLKTGHCFSGYYDRPDLTARVMRDGWHCTGDLGYLAGGELYILGRKDDLLIIGGQNIQPQAIEEVATAVLGAQGRLAVAFSLRDENLGTQTAVLVCETRDEAPAEQLAVWRAAITRQVYAQLEITLADLRFVPKGWVVQMDAKLGRAASREKYLAAGYRPEAPGLALLRAAGEDPAWLEQGLLQLAGQMLGVSAVGPEDDFFALGGDSLTALRFVLAVEEATGRCVPTEYFREPTMAHLVRLLVGYESPVTADISFSPQAAPAQPATSERSRTWTQGIHSLPRRCGHASAHQHRGTGFSPLLFRGRPVAAALADSPWVQRFFYPGESQLVRRFAQNMGTPIEMMEQQVALSLAGHAILARWAIEASDRAQPGRRQSPLIAELVAALASAPESSLWRQYLDTEGVEYLNAAIDKGRGAIAVTVHTPTRYAVLSYFAQFCVPSISVGNRTYEAAVRRLERPGDGDNGKQRWWTSARAVVASEAYAVLRRGGVISIAGDEQNTANGVTAVIGDRLHHLSPGFAELAVATGATVLPIYSALLSDGRVRLTFAPPLTWDQRASRSEQVMAIVQAYAHLQTALWQDMPSIVSKEIITQHLKLPQMSNETSV